MVIVTSVRINGGDSNSLLLLFNCFCLLSSINRRSLSDSRWGLQGHCLLCALHTFSFYTDMHYFKNPKLTHLRLWSCTTQSKVPFRLGVVVASNKCEAQLLMGNEHRKQAVRVFDLKSYCCWKHMNESPVEASIPLDKALASSGIILALQRSSMKLGSRGDPDAFITVVCTNTPVCRYFLFTRNFWSEIKRKRAVWQRRRSAISGSDEWCCPTEMEKRHIYPSGKDASLENIGRNKAPSPAVRSPLTSAIRIQSDSSRKTSFAEQTAETLWVRCCRRAVAGSSPPSGDFEFQSESTPVSNVSIKFEMEGNYCQFDTFFQSQRLIFQNCHNVYPAMIPS